MKKTIISSCICFFTGIAVGISGLWLYNNKKSINIEKNTAITVIQGPPDTIKHDKIKNYPKHIEFITKSKGKGAIKTTIKKDAFCPKIYKNALSLIVYAGIQDLQPVLSYGIEYRRQVFSRFHLLTGIKIDTNIYRVNGFQGFVGAGVNF